MARCRAGRRCDCRRPEVGGEAGAGDDGPTRLHQHQGQRESGVDRERHHLRQHRLVVAAIDLFKDTTATDWIGYLKTPLRRCILGERLAVVRYGVNVYMLTLTCRSRTRGPVATAV